MNDDLLYQHYFEPIKRYLRGYVGESYAEELAQEVFVKITRSRDGFRGDSSIKSWIYRIATNVAKDFLKSRYKKDSDMISESDLSIYDSQRVDEDSPESLSITKEMNECIKEFVYRLPTEYATVLVLSHLAGHKVKEISEMLGESQNAVKVRLHRARAKLREDMEQGCVITTTCDDRMVCERKY